MPFNTKEQVRRLLGIEDNSIRSVMNSIANPILAIYDEATSLSTNMSHITNKKDYICEQVLRDCVFFLEAMEMKMRALTYKITSIKRTMQPFREYYARMKKNIMHDYVRNLLL